MVGVVKVKQGLGWGVMGVRYEKLFSVVRVELGTTYKDSKS